jgi:hypothetical protein
MGIELIEDIDLFAVISADIGPPEARHGAGTERNWWLCPFHPDQNPSLTIFLGVDGKHRYKCFACNEVGDAIDFIRMRNPKISFTRALDSAYKISNLSPSRKFQVGQHGQHGHKYRSTHRLTKLRPPPSEEWQDEQWNKIHRWEDCLHSEKGSSGLRWLKRRGLTDDTITSARLGYNKFRKAISIPWFDGSRLRLVNMRRLKKHSNRPKYEAISGSVKGSLYPSRQLEQGRPIVFVEGEFNCLLVNQVAGDLAQAVTLGSASDRPSADMMRALLPFPFLLVAYDADAAGDKAAKWWTDFTRRAIRLRPRSGKDVTDMHLAGVDVRAWLSEGIKKGEKRCCPY